MTNPRVRDEAGEIALVPPGERVSGPGASLVMASFTHRNLEGSRFSDGRYGVYYAARQLETAITETAHHFAAFARAAHDPPRNEDMRVLVGAVDAELVDVAAEPEPLRGLLLAPDSYAASQPYGAARRETGAAGLAYPSVRRPGGDCLAAFRPRTVGVPLQERRLQYRWDGARVDRYFDYAVDRWMTLED